MADISFKQSRGEILRGMMRNPSISRTIKDAMSSDLGSTSRQKAKKLLSIMNKLYTSHDGLGGPGMQYERMAEAPQPDPVVVPTDTPKGMVIFHKIPTPNIIYGKKPVQVSRVTDGIGGPGKYNGKGGPFDTNVFTNSSDIYNTQQPDTSVQGPKSGVGAYLSNLGTELTMPGASVFSGNPAQGSQADNLAKYNATHDQYGNLTGPYTAPAAAPSSQPPSAPVAPGQVPKSGVGAYLQNWWTEMTMPGSSVFTGDPSQGSQWDNLQKYNSTHDQYGNIITPAVPASDNNNGSPTTQPAAGDAGKTDSSTNTNSPSGDNKTAGPSATDTQYADNWSAGMKGYGAEIDPSIDGNRLISSLTPAERQQLTDAQKTREGSTLSNNPFGIKVGSATQHWIDEGKARLGSKASDGGQFLVFKDEATANAAHDELLYNNPAYSGLTVDAAMKQWSGYGPATTNATDTTTNPDGSTTSTNNTPDKSYQQTIWDKYDISNIQADRTNVSKEINDSLDARHSYLMQTDAAINGIMDKTMSTLSSDPGDIQNASNQLSYLYSLRGNATQSFLGQLNDDITQNQNKLSEIDSFYGTAVTAYENEIKNAGQITPQQYALYQTALDNFNKSIDASPSAQNSLTSSSINLLQGTATSVSDAVKLSQQQDLLTQAPEIEKYWGWDGTKTQTNIDLVKTIQDLASLAPTILPVNIIAAYENTVTKYIGQPNDTNTTPSGTNINSATKQTALKSAITQFANLYKTAEASKDSTISLAAYSAMNDMASHLSGTAGATLLSKAPQLKTAVQSLNPKGWFGAKAAPSEAQFIDTITKATGNTGDASIASAVYAAFKQYLSSGGTPEGAVNSLLYKTSSTTTKNVPFTDDEFTQNLGNIYTQSLINNALGL